MKTFVSKTFYSLVQEVQHEAVDNSYLPELPNFIEATKSEMHAHCGVLFIIDFVKGDFLHVDETCNYLLGYNANFLRNEGLINYKNMWHKNDWKIFNEKIFPADCNFLQTHHAPASDYLFSFNYRIKNSESKYIPVLQRTIYIVGEHRLPVAAISCSINLSNYRDDSTIVHTIEQVGPSCSNNCPSILHKQVYNPDFQGALSKREAEILHEISEGLKTKEIAKKLSRSIHTINNHRKHILEKTHCRTAGQLIKYAVTKF